jgi:hypothetical protein
LKKKKSKKKTNSRNPEAGTGKFGEKTDDFRHALE